MDIHMETNQNTANQAENSSVSATKRYHLWTELGTIQMKSWKNLMDTDMTINQNKATQAKNILSFSNQEVQLINRGRGQ